MPPAEATLTRLHADYALSAYRFAWSVTKDEGLAQEVVQELFLKLARDADAITRSQSERAVIFTLVRNLALDALRRRAREERALCQWEEQVPTWFEPSHDKETQQQITAALAKLPEEQRSVVHLHVWEDLSFREIGELLALPTQTIASRYRYALEKLRAHKDTRMKPDPEHTLRTLRWRDPPPEFLKHTLEMALTESRRRLGVRRSSGAFECPPDSAKLQAPPAPVRKRHLFAWLAFIPRPLRLPLAACWLLAFFFRVTTPEAIPQSTLENYAKLPSVTPAQLLAHREITERLAHELAEQRRGPIPPL